MIAEKKGLCRVLFLLYWGKMSSNYREGLVKALIKFYEGGIEAHIMNIEVLLGSHVGLAEHGDIIETLDAELDKLSSLEDKLEVLKKHFT